MTWMMDALNAPLFRAIGWALVDFLWQGLVLAVLFRAALGTLRNARASTRYLVGCAGLLLMAVAPVAGAVSMLRSDTPPAPWAVSRQAAPAVATPIVSSTEPSPSLDAASSAERGERGPVAWTERAHLAIQPWLPLVVLLWLAGVMVGAARLMGGWVYLRRLRTRWTCEVGDAWTALFDRLVREVGIARGVRLLGSTRIDVPAVAGALKPVILVPAALLSGLSPADVELILAHELAHVRRHDYLVNLLQSAVETVLFFHPGVWWLSALVREEREHCCDDAVVAATGRGKRYARALLAAEEMRAAGPGPRLAPALGGGSLTRRIRRIVAPGEVAPSPGGGPLGLALTAMLVLALAVGQAPLAAAVPTRPGAAAPLPAPGTLADRWREGRARAAAAGWQGEHWIGYAVEGTSAHATSSSSMRGADEQPGSPLADQLARRGGTAPITLGGAPQGTQVVLLFRMASPRDSVPAGMKVWTADRPVSLSGLPVVWLGTAPQGESLGLLGMLYPAVTPDVRSQMAAAASLHDAGPQALGFVQRILESEPSDAVRGEAAFWLQHQETPEALALLERTARGDRSAKVGEEAVTAIAQMRTAAGRDALARLERDAPQLAVRREAGDWLMRSDPRR
jgi:beta-lactamase regulating signal transducer with metallopeptidase domain